MSDKDFDLAIDVLERLRRETQATARSCAIKDTGEIVRSRALGVDDAIKVLREWHKRRSKRARTLAKGAKGNPATRRGRGKR